MTIEFNLNKPIGQQTSASQPQQTAQNNNFNIMGILQSLLAQPQAQLRAQANNWGGCIFNGPMMNYCPDPFIDTLNSFDYYASIEKQRRNFMYQSIAQAANMPTNGQSPTAPQAPAQNNSEPLKKLTNENLNRLKDLEEQIKAKQEEYDAAVKNDDKKAQSDLAKDIYGLREEYQKAEKDVLGSSVSKKYDKEFNFYTNLGEKELEVIKNEYSKIDDENKRLQNLEQQLAQKEILWHKT